MSVHFDGDIVRLEGVCTVDDAEPLLRLLQEHPGASIDWQACDQAHTAIIQILMAARRPIAGPPNADQLERWVAPLLGELRG